MNLRLRFILSNVLPLFLILPLIGLILVFSLERLVFIPKYSAEIEKDVDLIARIITHNPAILASPDQAQAFVDEYTYDAPWRVILFDPDGMILASNRVEDGLRLGSKIENPLVPQVLEAGKIVLINRSRGLSSEIIDIWKTIESGNGKVLGIARISQPLESIAEELMQLRFVVTIILLLGLAVGTLIGLGLAISLERPLQTITTSLREMAWTAKPSLMETRGPEDLQLLTEAFNHLVERLHGLESQQKKLLANLVHELGRPIGALRSSVQALLQGAADDLELRQELLAGMEMQTHSLERLLDDLTNLYDTTAGKFELKRERIDLNLWLQESLAPWRTFAKEKDLQFRAESDTLPSLWIDPLRLGQALGNLVSNAIKFTPKHGEVSVYAQLCQDQVCINVEDSGPGLSEEDLKSLFTPFYRGRQGTRFPQGMGLGLSIARDIILSHGGALEASNSPTAGARFTIRLQVTHPHPS